jgi:hypothetical protein
VLGHLHFQRVMIARVSLRRIRQAQVVRQADKNPFISDRPRQQDNRRLESFAREQPAKDRGPSLWKKIGKRNGNRQIVDWGKHRLACICPSICQAIWENEIRAVFHSADSEDALLSLGVLDPPVPFIWGRPGQWQALSWWMKSTMP